MTLTLRKLSAELVQEVKRRARNGRTSATRAAIEMLEQAAGVARGGRRRPAHHDLDDLFGSLSRKEADDLEKAMRDQRRIDPEQWR
jgi:hypothetical protein